MSTITTSTDADNWDNVLRAKMEKSNEHATDIELIGTCRKCEQNDPTYRYDDCPAE
jgi:hypothetical protein